MRIFTRIALVVYMAFIGNTFADGNKNLTSLDKNMVVGKADPADAIDWYSPLEVPFSIYGLKWEEARALYRRLPVNDDGAIPYKVDRLADAPAGGQIHFSTDSRFVWIRVELDGISWRYHMTPVGTYGCDAYKWEDGYQRFLGITRFNEGEQIYTSKILLQEMAEMNSFAINLPLYNAVKKIEIGLMEGSAVAASTHFENKPCIVVYGTSITQGSAASRPGMAYPNILSRMLGREVVNLGFSGAGKGEPALADCINEIGNKGLIILDFECNTHDALKEVLEPFVQRIRESDTATPILVLSRIHLTRDALGKWKVKRKDLTLFQVDLVQKFKDAGDDRIYFVDGRDLIDDEWKWEATVDGTHATDLGFSMMAKNLEPIISRILNSSGPNP
jgi:hypothetical protein